MKNTIDYDEIYQTLTEEQKIVLDEFVIRGKKTKWLNILAKKKGIVLSEKELISSNLDEIEWNLIDIEDAGQISNNLKCICGKSLRYRYTVKHTLTGVTYKLGKEHLAQYTDLDAKTVSEVVRGISKIDLERDEILEKVLSGWENKFKFENDFDIPFDMKEQLRVGLPLLNRQVRRLIKLLSDKKKKNIEVEKKNNIPFNTSEFECLYKKFDLNNFTEVEIKRFYEVLVEYKEEIENLGYSIGSIKEKAQRLAGKYGNNKLNMRNWICNIWFLDC